MRVPRGLDLLARWADTLASKLTTTRRRPVTKTSEAVLAEARAIMARAGGKARAAALSAAKRRAIARSGGLASAAARKRGKAR